MYWLFAGNSTFVCGYDGEGIFGFCGRIEKTGKKSSQAICRRSNGHYWNYGCGKSYDSKSVKRIPAESWVCTGNSWISGHYYS